MDEPISITTRFTRLGAGDMSKVQEVRVYHIPERVGIDAIDLFIVWYGGNASQITIRCWDRAWTGYRGGHWTEKAENYIVDCIKEGMIDHLVTLFARTMQARELKWLRDILMSINTHLIEQGFKAEANESV